MEQTNTEKVIAPVVEKKERDHVAGGELMVYGIEVIEDAKVAQQVKKVTIITSAGDVTYKPKSEKETFRSGFKVKTQEPSFFSDLSPVLKEIALKCTAEGKVRVKAHFQVWNTEKDGLPVTYRYVQGSKMMDKWEIVKPAAPGEVDLR